MLDIGLCFAWSTLVVLFSVPAIIKVAHRRTLFDRTQDRSTHKGKIPRLGGIAIAGAFITGILIFGEVDKSIQYLLAATLIIIFIGLKDDLEEETSFRKFFVQILAALIIVLLGRVMINNFHGFWGIYMLSDASSIIFSIVLFIGVTNSFNLIDGIDGLAGSITFIIAVTLGFLFYAVSPSLSMVSFALAGVQLGFLRYNLVNAKVFMGDTGSLLSGFVVAYLLVNLIQLRAVPAAPAVAIALMIVPLFDTLRVFILRIVHGRSPFMPDRNHVHHKLLELGLSQVWVVALLVLINALMIVCSIIFADLGTHRLVLIEIGIMILLGILLEVMASFKTDDHATTA